MKHATVGLDPWNILPHVYLYSRAPFFNNAVYIISVSQALITMADPERIQNFKITELSHNLQINGRRI